MPTHCSPAPGVRGGADRDVEAHPRWSDVPQIRQREVRIATAEPIVDEHEERFLVCDVERSPVARQPFVVRNACEVKADLTAAEERMAARPVNPKENQSLS